MSGMTHVTEELELFALDVLAPADRARIVAHLTECPACREQARLLDEVALALPDTLPQQEPPARLRARLLDSARAELAAPAAARAGTAWTSWSWRSPMRLSLIALALAVLVLGAVDVAAMRDLAVTRSDRDTFADFLVRVSHGGKSWYMTGRDQWAGSGGTLYAPRNADSPAFVVFHDLRPLSAGAVYTLWLVDADGRWARIANFTPTGEAAQGLVLDTSIEGYMQCAVTVELQREGKRAGPLVMQSRLAQAPPQ